MAWALFVASYEAMAQGSFMQQQEALQTVLVEEFIYVFGLALPFLLASLPLLRVLCASTQAFQDEKGAMALLLQHHMP